jgi:hypothetical protein
MKKRLIITLCLCWAMKTMAQSIVDPNFAQAIRDYCPSCLDNVNRITEDGQKLKNLTIAIQNISDITGVIGFSSLTSLNCGNNKITFIPPLPSGLKTLFISYNKLENLNNLPNSLTALYCNGNQLKNLSNLPSELKALNCSYNVLTTLPPLPLQLKTFFCSNNRISALPKLPKTLEALDCANNTLKNLPQLPNVLSFLGCQNNTELSCLPKLPDSLTYLYISKGIVCLPNIIKNVVVESYEGIIAHSVNLPICTNVQLAFCPPELADPIEPDKKISVYPNPTADVITIKHYGTNIIMIEVINYLGQIVKKGNTDEIDLTELETGCYLIRVETNEDTVLTKIVKQ